MSKVENRKITDYIYTYSGKAIYPEEMTVDDVVFYDIAYSLSQIKRYNGHSGVSVLRHSLAAYNLLINQSATIRELLFGLLHDATEAYLMDVPVPLQKYMSLSWKSAVDHIEETILKAAGISEMVTGPERAIVHVTDKMVVPYEMDYSQGIYGSYDFSHVKGSSMRYPAPHTLTLGELELFRLAYHWDLTDQYLITLFLETLEHLIRQLKSQ